MCVSLSRVTVGPEQGGLPDPDRKENHPDDYRSDVVEQARLVKGDVEDTQCDVEWAENDEHPAEEVEEPLTLHTADPIAVDDSMRRRPCGLPYAGVAG